MKPPDIRLVVTDLDGTLLGSASEFPLYAIFRDKINELRSDRGTIWAICTGRTMSSFKEVFAGMRTMGIVPDYVIIRHAYIYERNELGYWPHILWNFRIRHHLWADRLYIEQAIEEWHQMIRQMSPGVRTLRKNHDRLRLRFSSEESAALAAEMLTDRVRTYKHLMVFRYQNEVDIRAVPFTKGLAMSELARRLYIAPENILVIGDGHNDSSMLSGGLAMMTGCPANAAPEIIEIVHKKGGHIARTDSLAGTIEILDAHLNGTVNSALPAGWKPPCEGENPSRIRPPHRHDRGPLSGLLLAFGAGVAVLLVLASFRLIPFSSLILKPVTFLAALAERLFRYLGF